MMKIILEAIVPDNLDRYDLLPEYFPVRIVGNEEPKYSEIERTLIIPTPVKPQI